MKRIITRNKLNSEGVSFMGSQIILLTVYWIDEEEEVSCSRFSEEDFSRQASRRSAGTEETWNSRFYRWGDSHDVCKLYRKCQDFFSSRACFYLFLHRFIVVNQHYVISTSSPVRISWAAVISHFLPQEEIFKKTEQHCQKQICPHVAWLSQ